MSFIFLSPCKRERRGNDKVLFWELLNAPALSLCPSGCPHTLTRVSSVSYDTLTGEQTGWAQVFNNSNTGTENKTSTRRRHTSGMIR